MFAVPLIAKFAANTLISAAAGAGGTWLINRGPITELENKLKEANNKLQEAQEKLETANKKFTDSVENHSKELNKQSQDHADNLNQLKTTIEALETQKQELEEKLTQFTAQLTTQIGGLTNQLSSTQQSNEQLQEEYEKLKQDIETILKNVSESSALYDKANKTITEQLAQSEKDRKSNLERSEQMNQEHRQAMQKMMEVNETRMEQLLLQNQETQSRLVNQFNSVLSHMAYYYQHPALLQAGVNQLYQLTAASPEEGHYNPEDHPYDAGNYPENFVPSPLEYRAGIAQPFYPIQTQRPSPAYHPSGYFLNPTQSNRYQEAPIAPLPPSYRQVDYRNSVETQTPHSSRVPNHLLYHQRPRNVVREQSSSLNHSGNPELVLPTEPNQTYDHYQRGNPPTSRLYNSINEPAPPPPSTASSSFSITSEDLENLSQFGGDSVYSTASHRQVNVGTQGLETGIHSTEEIDGLDEELANLSFLRKVA